MVSIPQTDCDIFCKVVDNFGDLGVCWRLATQLAAATPWQIRVWVDDIALAQRFVTDIPANVSVCEWQADAIFTHVASVVLETFSCGLPDSYQARMLPTTVWLNIEYLTAEAWVDDFHLKPSPQPNGLRRYFYFPGFTPASGGVLCAHHSSGAHHVSAQLAHARLGIDFSPNTLTLSLFCYAPAPMAALIAALQHAQHPVQVLVPDSVAPWLCQALALPPLARGQAVVMGQVRVMAIPFLSQPVFDALLVACDLNFVRGEDSWVRAIWAGKPFVWMPYPQAEATHLTKLKAFLQLYLAQAPNQTQTVVRDLMMAWSGTGDMATAMSAWLQSLPAIGAHAKAYAEQLATQPDLVTKLLAHIEKLQTNRV